MCKDAEGNDEAIKCGEEGKGVQSRNKKTGVWECDGDTEEKDNSLACGDTLFPGVARDKKSGICWNKDEDDEAIKCGEGKDSEAQKKNPRTGVWECPEGKPAQKCGDGYAAGDIEKRLKDGVCSDESSPACKDGTPYCFNKKAAVDGKCSDENDRPPLYCEDPIDKEGDPIRAKCNSGKQPGGHQKEDEDKEAAKKKKNEERAKAREASIEKANAAQKLIEKIAADGDATDADSYLAATKSFDGLKNAYDELTKNINARVEEEKASTEETAKLIDKRYKDRPDVAKANTAGANSTNEERAKNGAPPLALDEEVAFEAQEYLDTWECIDDPKADTPKVVEPSKAAVCREKKEERRRLAGKEEENDDDSCQMNVWTNPDGAEGTTAEKAV
jgi:uncharacterized protein YkwD